MATEKTQFDRESLEALKTLGKTLGQMSLYKIGHPAVAAMLATAEELLAQALAKTQSGELSFSFDQEKLIANGRIIGSLDNLPSSVTAFFTRFKLNSLTFKTGLASAELAAFCELAAARPDAAVASDPQRYLAERGVEHILFSEAVYAKMGDEALLQVLEQKSIEETVRALVGNAVSDPKQHKKIYEKVMELVQRDVERRVDEVVKPLRVEKNMLQNDQARTQNVIQQMVDGIVVVDEQGKVLMMNPAAEEMYGTTLAEIAGLPLTSKAGEEHMITLSAEIATPVDHPIKGVVQTQGVDDTRRTIKASTAVVQNEAGKVVGMVSTLPDVAKQKELQKIEREFVAHVTHELRAPLSSIKAALDILQEEFYGKLQGDQDRMLKSAISNSERLENLINGILDFSKIESGQMTVYGKPVNPEKIATEAVESLKAWAAKKKLALFAELGPALPLVTADAGRTVQVLVNLIANAIKFTPAGGKIAVRASRSTAEKTVVFSVTDTGCGIPAAEHQRIFEKFIQIASGEMHVGGTGLGLAIAKALVHMQGGKMWVESASGKGATFFFTLPVCDIPSESLAPPAAKPWWKTLLGID